MKIGELARDSGTPVDTIRYYERAGLLPAPARSAANYRHYSPAHAERLAFIRRCRGLDMALDEIRALLQLKDQPGQDCQGVNTLVEAHIAHVNQRIAELQTLADQLQALRNCCSGPQEVRDCGILQGLSQPGDLPPGPLPSGHVLGSHAPSLPGSPGVRVRPLQEADLPAVMQIQAECYHPGMVEPLPLLRQRLHAAPGWAWVAQTPAGLGAYLWSYPSRLGQVTPLGADFAPAPEPDCLYLHDLAVSPRAQGQGLGAALIRHAWATARQAGLAQSALVAVQDSARYWQGWGYVLTPVADAASQAALRSYVGQAEYRVCPLRIPR